MNKALNFKPTTIYPNELRCLRSPGADWYILFLMDKLKRQIINKYDFFLYHLAFNSLKRLSLTDIGFVYLLELWLRNWRLEKGISKELKSATESFFQSLVNKDDETGDF